MPKIRVIVVLSLCLLGCSSPPEPIPVSKLDDSFVRRGEYLTKSLAACGFCHGESANPSSPLSGGRRQVDVYGEATAPNITSHQSGIGGWNITKLAKAIRHSIREDGEGFSPYFHRGFEWMSDIDAMAIGSYLQSLPPVKNSVERREVGFLTRNTVGLFRRTATDVPGYVPPVLKRETLKFGEYLVDHVARCGHCHNSPGGLWEKEGYLTGGMDITVDGEVKVAPELAGSPTFGLGSWSEEEIVTYLRTGTTPDKRDVDQRFCPIPFYRMGATDDLKAIAKYLKNLPT